MQSPWMELQFSKFLIPLLIWPFLEEISDEVSSKKLREALYKLLKYIAIAVLH